MKLSASILALSVFNAGLMGTSAFFVQTPKSQPAVVLRAKDDNVSTRTGSSTSRTFTSGVSSSQSSFAGALNKANKSQISRDGDKWNPEDYDSVSQVTVQGGSLRTWSFASPTVERVQVLLRTEGRPLNTDVELWHGPDNTPQKMRIYSEDGDTRPISIVVETPRSNNAIAVRNIASMEYPLSANVEADDASGTLKAFVRKLSDTGKPMIIQGGAVRTYPFAPQVDSVQIELRTDGRPLNARIELLQGPNNNKQVMEVYTEDGTERPFIVVIETPGVGNVVRIVNTGTVEFPLTARVEAYQVQPGGEEYYGSIMSSGGDSWWMDRF
jgi:hypothetical protein